MALIPCFIWRRENAATLKLRLTDVDPRGSMDPELPWIGGRSAAGQHTPSAGVLAPNDFGEGFDALFAQRQKEADEFYDSRIPRNLSADARMVMRQAYSGLLWSKQFYHYDVETWLEGDPAGPAPPAARKQGPQQGLDAPLQR